MCPAESYEQDMPIQSTFPAIRFAGASRLRFGAMLLAGLVASRPAPAQVVRGSDWIVAYSLPSQSEDIYLKNGYAIRDLLVAGFGQLQEGQQAHVATYTFSGDSIETGAAAPILESISMALDRGANVHFVVDSAIKRSKEFQPGLSLNHLARRRNNPLSLSVGPRATLMHHKVALFDYGDERKWTLVASGNFTRAANQRQWNIAVLLRNIELHQAFAAEMDEFHANRFSNKKSRDHDRANFRLEDSWGTCWVRFGPYPRQAGGGVNAETDIRRLIQGAQEEIYFSMHRFNRAPLRRDLVEAANRGIKVVGVIPESDRGKVPPAISRKTVNYFANPANYTTTNRVTLLPARASAIETTWDSGEQDLVHTKYAIIDPNGKRPFVVHGAANWTVSGLVAPSGNDESTLILRHRGIAQAFLEQFQRMTATPAQTTKKVEKSPK